MSRRFWLPFAGLVFSLANNPAFAGTIKSADFTTADVAGKGLVLLSTSADGTNVLGTTQLWLKRIGVKNGKKHNRFVTAFPVDNPFIKSHSQTEQMNVHWRALEPGDYVLERMLGDPNRCFDLYISYRFTVTPGTSIYLGNFHLEGGVPTIRDSYQRDFAYFNSIAGGEKPNAFTTMTLVEKSEPDPSCDHHIRF